MSIDELRAPRWRGRRFVPLTQSAEAHALAASGGFHPEHLGLLALCQQLPPPQRQVMDLIYHYGLTFEQTAQRLSLPKSTYDPRAGGLPPVEPPRELGPGSGRIISF